MTLRAWLLSYTLLAAACGGGQKASPTEAGNLCAGNPCGENPCGGNPCGGSSTGEAPSADTGIDWSDYRSWTRVSDAPFPSKGHKKAWVDVYVTPDHAETYRDLEGPLPEGAGIVKVAYEDEGGQPGAPVNLTVMAKMAAGYDADHGDWYYGVLDPTGGRAMQQGRVDTCIGCHGTADIDYVFGIPR